MTIDWTAVAEEVDEYGCALLPRLLTKVECADIAALYDEPDRFRATIDMARHRFGRGQYRFRSGATKFNTAASRSRNRWPGCGRSCTRTCCR